MEQFQPVLDFVQTGVDQIYATINLFWLSLVNQLNLVGVIDILLVFAVLWWLYKKLRRTDLIKILPRMFLLLIAILIARMLGLWALFYFGGFLLLVSLLSIASLYATDIKSLLETAVGKSANDNKSHPVTSSDIHSMIRSVTEALAVLVRSEKAALIVIKRNKPLAKLVDNGTKMNSVVKPELLIDFFSSGSELSKGAVILEGNRILAAGSTLWQPNAKILFNSTNPIITRVAEDLDAVVIVSNKTIGDIHVISDEDVYKNLSPKDLTRLLQNLLIFNRDD